MRPFFNKMKKKPVNIFLFIFLVIATLTVVNVFFPFSQKIRSVTFSLTSPVQETAISSGSSFFPFIRTLQNSKEIAEKIDSLEKENRALFAKIAQMNSLKEENKELKKILDLDFNDNDFLAAQVIARDTRGHTVNIKHIKGAREGDFVTTTEGVLVGIITENSGQFSKVELLTSPDSVLEVKIQSNDMPIGILRGVGERILRVDTLPREKEISRGDLVVGRSHKGSEIDDIYIGRVVDINESAVDAFQSAKVWQNIDLRYIKNLLIIQNEAVNF